MGRTSKPVKILVHPDLMAWEEITALREQGHEIGTIDMWDDVKSLDDFDLILGPQAWNMDDSLRPYLLSHAIPAARKAADERRKKGVL